MLRTGRAGMHALTLLAAALIAGPLIAQHDGARFGAIDQRIEAVLRKWDVPGAAVAITRRGALVFAAGYGMADREAAQPMKPETLLRLASLSKSVTAIGVLRLVEEGRLDLDAKAFALLDLPTLPPDVAVDPRLGAITVRHLLQHTAGWQIAANQTWLQRVASKLFPFPGAASPDPFLPDANRRIAKAMGVAMPADCPTVIQYMRRQPLAFDPGTRFEYANLNYCILGRVIEHASGQPYFDYMQEHVLKPSGIVRARLARTLLGQRLDGEARYYTPASPVRSAISESSDLVPWPYGGFSIEGMDAFGGWVMSPIDVLRLIAATEGRRRGPLLSKQLLAQVEGRPAPPVSVDAPTYYGLGFSIRPGRGGANWWNYGYLPGTAAYVVRSPNGFAGAILANGTAATDADSSTFTTELEQALTAGAGEIEQWPTEDQFERFP